MFGGHSLPLWRGFGELALVHCEVRSRVVGACFRGEDILLLSPPLGEFLCAEYFLFLCAEYFLGVLRSVFYVNNMIIHNEYVYCL